MGRNVNEWGKTCWNQETATHAADLVIDLVDRFPNTRFFGVGNSPSYLVYGINHLSQKTGAGIETGYVPFSSRYLVPKLPSHADCSAVFFFHRGLPEFRAAVKHNYIYRKRLASIGLHPQKIMEDFERDRRKTAIMDNIGTGASFASFAHFMYKWARSIKIEPEKFSEALTCIGLTDEPFAERLTIPQARLSIPLSVICIQGSLRYALNSSLSLDIDRFIPPYNPKDWGSPPVDVESVNHDQVVRAKQLICNAIDTKIAYRPGLRSTPHSYTP